MFSDFFSKSRTVYEIMSKNMVEQEGPQIIWRPSTHAHKETCNICCFFTHESSRERASVLRYTTSLSVVPDISSEPKLPPRAL